MNIKQDMSSLSSKIIATLAIGVMALALYLVVIPANEDNPIAPTVSNGQSSKVATQKTAAKDSNETNVSFPVVEKQGTVRNPFAIPPEYMDSKDKGTDSKLPVTQQPVPDAGQVAAGISPAALELPKFSVTGIVSSDDGQQLAVINDGKHSKAYRLGEQVGAYQVESIMSDMVVVSGPAGQLTLPITNNIKTEKSMAKERTGNGNDSTHNVAQ
ncbi:hypothetical protein [Propionispora hippei]|uniref:Uncharacterized protein n=1 Tax=Propionispora hippei DSM 15287 TaxID=1123003 RepID=A0A1M6AEZ6_9FIRM|nr:hypothetical protein [Propionispora hippei]SHI34987.1 hypothetical protein SAMN02745170_00135 [Propionispora hippei DSM 15287]